MLVTNADQLTVRLHLSMLIMRARELPTREARIEHMRGRTFRGPHFYLTRDEVVVDDALASEIADLLERESPEQRAEHLRKLQEWRAEYEQRRGGGVAVRGGGP